MKKGKKLLHSFTAAISIVFLSFVHAYGVETIGRTYPVIERDALEELQEAVSKVDWEKIFDKEKWKEKIKAFRPEDWEKLPEAREERTRLVDMTYSLEFDIPDEKGNIIYPKGYTFNPLDFASLRQTLIIIDGGRKDQLEWYEQSPYFRDINTMLLISGGSWYDLMKKFRMPVYYLSTVIKNRLQLEAVPSIVRQKGRYMEVKEIKVEKKEKDSK